MVEQETDGRRAEVANWPVTHYVHMNAGGQVFVKDADLFAAQGGHLGTWGVAWHGINAKDLDAARRIGQALFTGGSTSAKEVDYSALEYRAVAHLIDEGARARRDGTPNPYRGNTIEHMLHARGWLTEDLRLALIDASPSYARSQGVTVQDKDSALFKNGYEAGFKDAQLERKSAWQDWVLTLTIMQQSVLASAVRAPDGMRKFHPAKMLVRWYRRSVLVSAFDGKPLLDPHAPGGGSFTGPLTSDYSVEQMADEFLLARDEMSLHYYAHMMHAAQIIGCYHPDDFVRDFWDALYKRMVNALHLNTESYSQMARRLSDSPEAWAERSDEAGSCTD